MRLGLSGQEGEAGNGGIVDLAIDIGEASAANRIEYKTTWWGARFARRPPQPTGQQFVRQTLGAARPQRRPARRRQRLHLQPRVAACGGRTDSRGGRGGRILSLPPQCVPERRDQIDALTCPNQEPLEKLPSRTLFLVRKQAVEVLLQPDETRRIQVEAVHVRTALMSPDSR